MQGAAYIFFRHLTHKISHLKSHPLFAFSLTPFRILRNAFTLVELMIVLVIIAMLAGLLAMTIRGARDRARATVCRNNLRQFGIAIGKYASDWDGYFIYPGRATLTYYKGTGGLDAGGGNIYASVGGGSDIMTPRDLRPKYEDGMGGGMGTYLGGWGAESGDNYINFIQDYVLSGNVERNVTHCPEVDMAIFDTNSPIFKGYHVDTNGYSADSSGQFTTYAINSQAQGQQKSLLKDCVFAFIDWNVAQGWGAYIQGFSGTTPCTNAWVMDKATVGAAVRNFYGDMGTLKSNCSYLTEIGYHHRSGANPIANYVAMDGHVDSIRSNAPQAEFRWLFLGY